MQQKILIIGACGQIGSELTYKLRKLYGKTAVVASDINDANKPLVNSGAFEILNAEDFEAVKNCCKRHKIDTIYLLAALLSATAEKHPMKAWQLNMNALFHVLNLAKDGVIAKVFFPSSIAVFGPTTPKNNTPQYAVLEPATVYGITKQVGERWCEYYFKNYNVDVRSLRYPGIISWKTPPGGGTTDYAVEIFHDAIKNKHYNCYLKKDTALPMMYMDDAINATMLLMHADSEKIKIRSSYNLSAVSFTPQELATAIKKHIPDFTINYEPDFRQTIADSWSNSIDDSYAKKDWEWQHKFDLDSITEEMIVNLKHTYRTSSV